MSNANLRGILIGLILSLTLAGVLIGANLKYEKEDRFNWRTDAVLYKMKVAAGPPSSKRKILI
jgi:hypothetical protein